MLVGKLDAGGIEYYLMGDINVSLAAPYSDNFLDRHAPVCIKRVRTSTQPWSTPQLEQSMHDRDVLNIKPIGSNDGSDWYVFKNCRNAVNNDLKLAKEMYYKNAFHENEGNSHKT